MTALVIENLHKTFSGKLNALKGINLIVQEGEFFALLGPNGAGKSTTIGIITSLINPSAGKIRVFGYDINKDWVLAKSCIGLVPQEINFNQFETVLDIVVNQAGFYGIPRKLALERAKTYLSQLNLWERRHSVSRTLSGGMKRRLMIARALIHEPRMLILDEPTAGVDIELRRSTWEFLQKINKQGTTIILTTHYLDEAEYLCNGIAIIDKGEIIKHTKIKELLLSLSQETIILDLEKPIATIPKITNCQLNIIDNLTLEIIFPKNKNINLNQLFIELSNNSIIAHSMRNKANRLEELFVNLTRNHG